MSYSAHDLADDVIRALEDTGAHKPAKFTPPFPGCNPEEPDDMAAISTKACAAIYAVPTLRAALQSTLDALLVCEAPRGKKAEILRAVDTARAVLEQGE